MDGRRFGRAIRALRHRRGWRQADLAAAAGVSQQTVARIESGNIAATRLIVLEAVASPFGAKVEVRLWGVGAELDQLIDARHAALAEATVARLRGFGWQMVAEVSYSEYGERGSIDALGWWRSARILLVVEVKASLGSIEETNRRHDQKVRLAAKVVRERFGWIPALVVRVLILPDESTPRRTVERHRDTFDSVLPLRGRALIAWLRRPVGPARGGIWFLSLTRAVSSNRRRVRIHQVGGSAGAGAERGNGSRHGGS